MAWDIYGDPLRKGHCEVHPWVHEDYPCSQCYHDSERFQHEADMQREYEDQLAAQEFAHYCAPWFELKQ